MSERTKKIEAVFHAASERSTPEERESYLNEACLGDERLRKEVDALLKAALAGEELFLGCEQSRISTGIPVETLAEQPGTVIGRYKLLEKIGEGGMGVVYMAEQEQPVRRKVALKIIKLGMDTRRVVARFEAERQALAMMDHPNIAQVLDAGATETGRPFFVMELVQGVPITQFCEANPLSVEERLKLLIPVCQAIQSAHQKGIIHRDIKPSNVLVTMHNGTPHPMVIDFGVAKAIDQKLTEKTLFTNFATMIGTPAYMSPEQAEMSKLDVDTRSDIYSLGVLLYELLTGTAPFPEERLRSVAYGEMQRIIAEEEPERPSTRLRKKAVPTSEIRSPKSDIDTDLDWIVMKCLEKNRDRRYETANGLVSDLQAHLNDTPVVARPPSATYRFQKLVRRHKLAFAAAGAVAFALVAGVSIASWQAVRATRAERSARAVKDFLLDQALRANPYVEPVPDPARATQLERMAQAVDLKFTNQPIIEAELRMVLAGGFCALIDYSNGLLQFQKALEIRQRLLGPRQSDTLRSLSAVVSVQIGGGRKIEERELLESAFNEIRKTSHLLSAGEAEVVWTYGDLLCSQDGDAAKGLPYLREGLEAFRRTADPQDYILHNKLRYLARATEDAGRFKEAERIYQESVQQAEREFGAGHILVAQFKKGQANFLRRRGRASEALPLMEFAAPIYHRVLGTNHQMSVDADMGWAEILDQLKRTDEAGRLYATLYQRWANCFADPGARERCYAVAQFFVRERRYEEAKAAFDTLGAFLEANPPKNPAEFDTFIQAAGATKGWPAAAELCQKEFDRFSSSPVTCRTMGTVFLYLGAEDWYRKVTAKAIALIPTTTGWQEQLAILHIAARGSFPFSPEQKTLCQTLIDSVERQSSTISSNERRRAPRAIGALQIRLGQLEQSLTQLQKASEGEAEEDRQARTLAIKALCLQKFGRIKEARAAFAASEQITQKLLPEPLGDRENFLDDAARYDLLLRRELNALLNGAAQVQ